MRFFRRIADPEKFREATLRMAHNRYAEVRTDAARERALTALCYTLKTPGVPQEAVDATVREMMAPGITQDLHAATRVACTGASPELAEVLMSRIVESGLADDAVRLLRHLNRRAHISEVYTLTARYVTSTGEVQATSDALGELGRLLPDRDFQIISSLLRKKWEKEKKAPVADISNATA